MSRGFKNWESEGNRSLTLNALQSIMGDKSNGKPIYSTKLGNDPTGVINSFNSTGSILVLSNDITLSSTVNTDFGNITILDAGGSITTPTGRTTTINKIEGEGYILKGDGDYVLNTSFVIPGWFAGNPTKILAAIAGVTNPSIYMDCAVDTTGGTHDFTDVYLDFTGGGYFSGTGSVIVNKMNDTDRFIFQNTGIDNQLKTSYTKIEWFGAVADGNETYGERTGTDNSVAFNKAIKYSMNSYFKLNRGVYGIKEEIDLSKTFASAYIIEGVGDNTILKNIGDTAIFVDYYTNATGRTATDLALIKNLRIMGDRAIGQTGFLNDPSRGDTTAGKVNFINVTFTYLDNGYKTTNGGLEFSFIRCQFRNNVRALHLKNVTQFYVEKCYFNGHNYGSPAIWVEGQFNENIKFVQTTMEANEGGCLHVDPDTFQGSIYLETYNEYNGDYGTDIPQYDLRSNVATAPEGSKTFFIFDNSKLGKNVDNGVVYSGINTLYRNCVLGDDILAPNKNSIIQNSYLGDFFSLDCTKQIQEYPVYFEGIGSRVIGSGPGQGMGTIASSSYFASYKSEATNLVSDPWNDTGIAVVASDFQPPTVSYDLSNKLYGVGSAKVDFIAGVPMSINNNSVKLDSGTPFSTSENDFIIYSMWVKADTDFDLQTFIFENGNVKALQRMQVTNDWKRLVVIGFADGNTSAAIPLWGPLNATVTPVTAYFTGFYVGVLDKNHPDFNQIYFDALSGKISY